LKVKQHYSIVTNIILYPTEFSLDIKHLKLLKKKNRRLYLIKEMASKWKDAGYQLDLSLGEIKKIEKDQQGDCYECCSSVMQTWLERGSKEYPMNWDGVLELLEDLELLNLVKKLQEMLS